jgi:Tfp pilus assembly protein PilE
MIPVLIITILSSIAEPHHTEIIKKNTSTQLALLFRRWLFQTIFLEMTVKPLQK